MMTMIFDVELCMMMAWFFLSGQETKRERKWVAERQEERESFLQSEKESKRARK